MSILLIRHGNTTYDTKVDALLNPPLDQDGVERIKRTIGFIRGRGFKIKRIASSPLQRALRVAEMLSDGNIQVTTHNEALPWNLGDLMGMEGSVVKNKLQYLKNYPDIRAPHGESYRTFYNRWTDFLDKLMSLSEGFSTEDFVITTHSRNVNALQSFIGGSPIGAVEESAKEGSVTLLAKNGVSNWTFNTIWEGN